MSPHRQCARLTRSFLFSRQVFSLSASELSWVLVCGARLREPKRVFWIYRAITAIRGRFVFRAHVEPVPHSSRPAAAAVSLYHSRRPRTTLRGRYNGQRLAIPGPVASRRLFVPFVYDHCAASRSPDYRDKQPEKPR